MLLHINAQLETWWNLFVERNGYRLICRCSPCHRPLLVARISRGADSWCSLQQRAINANNQIAFVTETRANYSRYESERGKNQIKQQPCVFFCPLSGVCRRCLPQACLVFSRLASQKTPKPRAYPSSRALEQSHDSTVSDVYNNI